MRLQRGVVMLVLFTMSLGTSAFADEKEAKDNSVSRNAAVERDPQFDTERNKKDPDEVRRDKAMAKARAKERFEQLQRDTNKLLQLATELKQYVDKSKDSILSVDVIRKAEEIEKLSKSVRDKMKGE